MTGEQISKRDLLKKAAYIAPAILTLKAIPSLASNGSGQTTRTAGSFQTTRARGKADKRQWKKQWKRPEKRSEEKQK